MTDSLTIQWIPAGGLPRKVTFDPHDDGYRRIEREWTGTEWRHCGTEPVTDCSLTPAAEPPTLEDLRTAIQDTWTTTDPQVLLFESPAESEAVAAVDGELRHRTAERDTADTTSEPELEGLLQSSGLPSVRLLSETPFERAQFTNSPRSTQR